MNNFIIKQAIIIDPNSKYHLQRKDIQIHQGVIEIIADTIAPDSLQAEIIEGKDLHVSPGWMDLRVNLSDPGFEYKETLESGAQAAIHGGFTAVACMGTTAPALHSKSQIEYIINKSKHLPIHIFPVGTVTVNAQGNDLAELYDMALSGAIAFSDYRNALANPDLLQRALQYSSGFDKIIIQLPSDKKIAGSGSMNEGIVSTKLGLKGIPNLAEELMLQRDLMIAAHHRTSIHIGGISTAGSVELIKAAKKAGVKVTCDVHVVNLALTDEALMDFDTNYKIMPPLRTEKDKKALIEGLKDGTIDVICSDHSPEDTESKVKEFDTAAFGMIGLETFYGILNKAIGKELSVDQIIEKIAINPRKIFDIPIPTVNLNQKAELTLFCPSETWTYSTENGFSKSKNSPFNKVKLTGKAVRTILAK